MHLFEVITEKTNVIMAYEFNFTGIIWTPKVL